MTNDRLEASQVSPLVRSDPGITPFAGPRRFALLDQLGVIPGQTCVEVMCASIINLQSLHSAATAKNKEPVFRFEDGLKTHGF